MDISTPPEGSQYTADELDAIADKYNKQQMTRHAEHEADRMKRMSKFSLDKDNQKMYSARAEQWREKAEQFQKVIFGEAESSKPKIINIDSVVDKQIINSPNYRKTFDKLGENPKITRSIFQQAKAILTHRSGGNFEDLSFIDSITGKFLTRTDYSVERQCIPSKRMKQMVKNAESNTIIAIHNHPNSSVPSLDDIISAYKKNYKYGIIACHNGNIYKYTVLGKFNELIVDNLLDTINKLVYNKNNIKEYDKLLSRALKQLEENSIRLEVLLWV